jgi:3-dehydroquinate dehydratase-2
MNQAKILLLQGPNLNLLGQREPNHYGHETLNDIHQRLLKQAQATNTHLAILQSNSESVLIDRVHEALSDGTQFILINPAAFTHQSVALRDALAGVALPFVEIHLSNVHAREAFRAHSYFSDKAVGVICGLGAQGYDYGLQFALHYLAERQ